MTDTAAEPYWLTLTEPDTEAAEELKAALARLRKDGWTRGKFHDLATGKCCALGAFGYQLPDETPGVRYLAYAIRTRKGGHRYPAEMPDAGVVVRFNDAARRKWAEVEAVFLAAIRYAEGSGTHVRPGN